MAPYSYLVLGVDPVSNEMNVELSTKIRVTFAKHINTDTLNSNTLRLRKVNGEFIEYTGRYINMDKVYEITPNQSLLPNTQYQTMVLGGVEGPIAIDGSYLPATKTYEFVTVQKQGIPALENLVLSQDYLFITAKWELPAGLIDGENIYFNVRLSTSNNPDAADLWPKNALEGKTTSPNITIPYKLEAGRSYYVHVQGVSNSKETAWLTQQIYIEDVQQTTSPDNEDTEGNDTSVGSGGGSTPINQLSILDHSPENGEYQKPSEIVVVFDDNLPVEMFQNENENNPLFYLVEAPYKETLSLIDLRGLYSVKNAKNGKVFIDSDYPNVLVWQSSDTSFTFKENTSYTVVVSKDIKGANTLPLGVNYTFGFVGTPEHLHGELDQIKEMLTSLNISPSTPFLQSLMKKYSQFACDIWFETDDYDDALHQNGDAPYFIHQYVNTQVLIDSLLHGGMAIGGGGDETVTLGELTVKKSGGSTGSSGASISDVITQLQSDLSKWEDLIHGHHNRGYASPGSTVKGENVQTVPAYVVRSTMNSDFDIQ